MFALAVIADKAVASKQVAISFTFICVVFVLFSLWKPPRLTDGPKADIESAPGVSFVATSFTWGRVV